MPDPGPGHPAVTPDVETLAAGFDRGDRRALAQAITLVESTRPDHQTQATILIERLLGSTGGARRIGISGPPGVGKSTFIEAFGRHVIDAGHRVAVLAVDPSSTVSGGSILGDKTRMAELARHPDAFIRPSPGGRHLGGVARRTREAMLLCEAFGFDVVIIETIGVGQSEVAVADLVDLFAVLVSPGGGDELQGIKRGIMELADLIVVNKADHDRRAAAERTRADYAHAVRLLRPKWETWTPRVLTCSAIQGHGIAEVWTAIEEFLDEVARTDELAAHRSRQAVAWMWSEVHDVLIDEVRADPAVRRLVDELEPAVAAGTTTPGAAARRLLHAYRR